MQKIGSLTILFFIFLFSISSFAKVEVTSTVDSDEVQVGVPFAFLVRVTSDEDGDIGEPRFDRLDGMNLVSQGKSEASVHRLGQTSSGMQFTVQRTVDYRFALTPIDLGRKTIPSVEVKVGNKAYRTQPLLISVVEEAKPRGRNAQRAQPHQQPPGLDTFDDEEDLFEQLLQQRQRLLQNFAQQNPGRAGGNGLGAEPGAEPIFDPVFRTLPKNHNEAFFVQVETDKLEVFEGEQVTAAWSIYTRGNMESLDRAKFPNLSGFWKEIIEEVPALQFGEEIVNGVPYRKALLAAHALFPIKAGTATIDEFKIKARVRTAAQGYNQRANEYTKSSQPVSIKVKPLPLEGRPAEFSGAVGEFEIRASVDKTNVTLNQPFSLKLRFEGKGNAKMIDLPSLPLPNQIERYDTKSDSRFFKNGTSFKEFEVLLIPRANGALEIPKMKIGFFNPRTASYYIKETEAIALNVEGTAGEEPRSGGTTLPTQAEKQKKSEDGYPALRASMDASLFTQYAKYPQVETGILFLLLSFFLGKTGMILFGGARRIPLKTQTLKKLKNIEKLITEKNPVPDANARRVGSEILNVLFEVVSEVTDIESSSRQLSEIVDALPLGFKNQFGVRLTEVLRTFEEISFAPDAVVAQYREPKRLAANVTDAKKLLLEIISTYSQS